MRGEEAALGSREQCGHPGRPWQAGTLTLDPHSNEAITLTASPGAV